MTGIPPHRTRAYRAGFTLIELLVVIAIISILATVLLIVLNPAQLLRQARDSNRISDLSTLEGALNFYLVDVTAPQLASSTSYCYAHSSSTVTRTGCGGRYTTALTVVTSTSRAVVGGGWIPVNFGAISAGSPLSIEPIDPINNATYWYSYAADTTNQTFVIKAKMESTRYSNGGSSDVESTDGGPSSTLYEVGTAPGLVL